MQNNRRREYGEILSLGRDHTGPPRGRNSDNGFVRHGDAVKNTMLRVHVTVRQKQYKPQLKSMYGWSRIMISESMNSIRAWIKKFKVW